MTRTPPSSTSPSRSISARKTRADRSRQRDKDNPNIQRTLNKVRARLVTKRAAKVMLVTNVSPSYMNRVIHEGSAYNVYASGKLADVIYGVTDGVIANAISRTRCPP